MKSLRRILTCLLGAVITIVVLCMTIWFEVVSCSFPETNETVLRPDVIQTPATNAVRRVPRHLTDRYDRILSEAMVLKRQDLSFLASLAESSESPLLKRKSTLDVDLPRVNDLGKRLIASLYTNEWSTENQKKLLHTLHWIAAGLRRERDLLCMMAAINLETMVLFWIGKSEFDSFLYTETDFGVLQLFLENKKDNAFSLLSSVLVRHTHDLSKKEKEVRKLMKLTQDLRQASLASSKGDIVSVSQVGRLQNKLDEVSSLLGKRFIQIWKELIKAEARLSAQREAIFIGLQHRLKIEEQPGIGVTSAE